MKRRVSGPHKKLVNLKPITKRYHFFFFRSLEQLEKENSSISDGYTLSIAFACLLEIVKSLDVLVQENNGVSSAAEGMGWIEPDVSGAAIETGVGTDTINENDKGKEKLLFVNDQDGIFPYNIDIILSRQVMREN